MRTRAHERSEIGADVADLFNLLTGYSRQREYRHLLVALHALRPKIIELMPRGASARQDRHEDEQPGGCRDDRRVVRGVGGRGRRRPHRAWDLLSASGRPGALDRIACAPWSAATSSIRASSASGDGTPVTTTSLADLMPRSQPSCRGPRARARPGAEAAARPDAEGRARGRRARVAAPVRRFLGEGQPRKGMNSQTRLQELALERARGGR